MASAFQRRIRKVGTPLGVIIALGAVAGLIVILMTAANPVGTAIGFVPSSLAMVVVVLTYLCVGPLGAGTAASARAGFPLGASFAVVPR